MKRNDPIFLLRSLNLPPLPSVKRVAVGTTNPVKVAATQRVIRYYWPEADIMSVDVPSGVDAQPWGIAETLAGARHRAHLARLKTDADIGVGLEGGVEEIPEAGGVFLTGWAAVSTREGDVFVGSGGRVLLPSAIVHVLQEGHELGEVMDAFSGQMNTKHTMGSAGILTLGFVDRESQFAVALAYALAPVLLRRWYSEDQRNKNDRIPPLAE